MGGAGVHRAVIAEYPGQLVMALLLLPTTNAKLFADWLESASLPLPSTNAEELLAGVPGKGIPDAQ
jgi:hypothetical protein